MAFPTSSLTNNQVHKEGNRAFVYDSTLGVWDQVKETNRTENKIQSGYIGSEVNFPFGHVLQVSAMAPNRKTTSTTGADVATAITHGITVTAGNNILVTATVPYRFTSGSSAQNYISVVWNLRHSTTSGGSFTNVPSPPNNGARQRSYIDNVAGTTVPANFYMDESITFNYLHESVSGTTHFYKVFMDGDGGTVEVSYNDSFSTMTLMEIQS